MRAGDVVTQVQASHGIVGGLLLTAAVITALLVLGGVVKAAWKVIRRTGQFLDDWNGEPSRPGVPEQPGVLARMAYQDTEIAYLKAELSPNSQKSIKDTVNRIDRNLVKVGDTAQEALDLSHVNAAKLNQLIEAIPEVAAIIEAIPDVVSVVGSRKITTTTTVS